MLLQKKSTGKKTKQFVQKNVLCFEKIRVYYDDGVLNDKPISTQ